MTLVLGIDLGTSYFKVGAFDAGGRLAAVSRIPVEKDEGGGRCEYPVRRFWDALRRGVHEALAQAGAQPGEVRALGYSSQANTFTLLSEAGEPLIPFIVWSDLRAPQLDPSLQDLWHSPEFLETTGLALESGEFAVNKLLWLQRHEPQLWARAARVMTISDTLTYGLTGQPLGDRGTAVLLGLWDLRGERWWPAALARAGLSEAQMSRMLRPGARAALLSEAGAARLDLTPGIPLAVGSLDHHMAALGAGIGSLADLCESTGTVLACLALSRHYTPRPGCLMGPGHRAGTWFQMTFNGTGGAGLEWYQRRFAPDLSIPELLDLAAAVPPGSAGLVARPEIQQYEPERGFIGRTADHGHGHGVRAILEANARALKGLIETLWPGDAPRRILATGGGVRSPLWPQLKADLLGMEVLQTACEEPACQGAALVAAVAAGLYPTLEDASSAWVQLRETFTPDPRRREIYQQWLATRAS